MTFIKPSMASHVKGEWSVYLELFFEIVHTILNDILGRHIKDKACSPASIPLYYRKGWRKHLHPIGRFGLLSSALNPEFTLLSDNLLHAKVANIGDR